MKLEIITLNEQHKKIIECDSFEFRSNQVSNWIMFMIHGEKYYIHNVAVIKPFVGSCENKQFGWCKDCASKEFCSESTAELEPS